MLFNVVFLDAGSLGDIDLSSLAQPSCQLTCYPFSQEEAYLNRAQDADVLIVNKCKITAELIGKLPRLKAILVAATGTDNIDMAAAKAQGIQVMNVRDYAETAVPQHVFALLLALTNNLFAYQQAVKAGDWSNSQHFALLDYPIMELAGKTMVIVGYGSLGQATAKLAKAFNMNVVIAERPDSDTLRPGRVAFSDALTQADVLSLHCPLLPSTQHLFNKQRFEQLKPGVIMINTARGGLIEPEALIDALSSGRVAAAGIDVLCQEPPPANDLLLQSGLKNLLITPHIGWASDAARNRMVKKIALNLADFIASKQYP